MCIKFLLASLGRRDHLEYLRIDGSVIKYMRVKFYAFFKSLNELRFSLLITLYNLLSVFIFLHTVPLETHPNNNHVLRYKNQARNKQTSE
jgi:hypothetical protein